MIAATKQAKASAPKPAPAAEPAPKPEDLVALVSPRPGIKAEDLERMPGVQSESWSVRHELHNALDHLDPDDDDNGMVAYILRTLGHLNRLDNEIADLLAAYAKATGKPVRAESYIQDWGAL